jgi:uncharacterized DUF497 family protein
MALLSEGPPAQQFEFDPIKSAENSRKHGIDFEAAQRLWDDAKLLELPARTTDETRWLVIAVLDGRHWSAIITRREQRIRLISVRRARDEEKALYESEEF